MCALNVVKGMILFMKKMNVIVIFNKKLTQTLMCIRTKEPYKGMYNLVGGRLKKKMMD